MIKSDSYLKLSQKYPHLYVFKFPDKNAVVFRLLSWGEYKSVLSLQLMPNFNDIKLSLEEEIFNQCLIDSSYVVDEEYGLDFFPAGVITTIVNFITTYSGVQTGEALMHDLQVYRPRYNSINSHIYTFLNIAQGYKKSEVDNMYWPDIVAEMVQAENMLMGNIPSAPLQLTEDENTKIDFEQENKETK